MLYTVCVKNKTTTGLATPPCMGAWILPGDCPESVCMLSWPWWKLRLRKSLILAYLLAISVASLLSGAAVLMNSGLQQQADSTPQHMIEVFPRFVHRPNFTEILQRDILIQPSRPSLNLSGKTLRTLGSRSHVRVGRLASENSTNVTSISANVISETMSSATQAKVSHNNIASENSTTSTSVGTTARPMTISSAQALKNSISLKSCILKNCEEFLSASERLVWGSCTRKALRLGIRITKSSCSFLPYSSREAVALASPEGSGNTWLRGLLEKATGVCTGFCCCDIELRRQGFLGEGVMSGKVLVVKTHIDFPQWVGEEKTLSWEGEYGSAVVLVRNPALSVVAEWNRRMINVLKKDNQTRGINSDSANSHIHTVLEEIFSMFIIATHTCIVYM